MVAYWSVYDDFSATLYTLLRQNKCIFIAQYVLLYVVTKSWCQLPEEGDNAKTCMNMKEMHIL
jgi:hypothetical protein